MDFNAHRLAWRDFQRRRHYLHRVWWAGQRGSSRLYDLDSVVLHTRDLVVGEVLQFVGSSG